MTSKTRCSCGCNKFFIPRTNNAKYATPLCAQKEDVERRKKKHESAKKLKPLSTRICACGCGEEFTQKHNQQKYKDKDHLREFKNANKYHTYQDHSKPKFVSSVEPQEVVCLGPGEDHTFMSPDPQNIRICDNCKGIIERLTGYIDGGDTGRRLSRAGRV